MERNTRKSFTGTVVSAKSDKTITVVVDTYKKAAIYGKRVKVSKKFHVHDEDNQAMEGDVVIFTECRPISKTKSFRLTKVVSKAVVI